jgi:dihydrofolate synthase/folylpolyglutamate synthase
MPHWPKIITQNLVLEESVVRTKALLDRLGNPEKRLPPAIHVVGTNGKGSTIAFLKAMLEAGAMNSKVDHGSGKAPDANASKALKVHVYTSPHIHQFNERIQIGGSPISDDELFATLEECREKLEGMEYSFFEATTAAAFLVFSRHPADYMLVEGGCGGRFDATNALQNIAASVITSISADHEGFLGKGLARIGWHKAGIMRGCVPCISADQMSEAMLALAAEATESKAMPFFYGYHWGIEKTHSGFTYLSESGEINCPNPGLPGDHQLMNSGNAIAVIDSLCRQLNLVVDHQAMAHGLRNASWPARLERVMYRKVAEILPKGAEVYMDAAHNVHAAEMIARYISGLSPNGEKSQKYAVVGLTRGKDVRGFLQPILEVCEKVILMQVKGEPNAHTPQEIIAKFGDNPGFVIADDTVDALCKINDMSTEEGTLRVFFCGSMYLARDLAHEMG